MSIFVISINEHVSNTLKASNREDADCVCVCVYPLDDGWHP